MRRLDLTGQRFGALEVLGYDGAARGAAYWHCRCECGATTVVRGSSLRAGATRSCGCAPRGRPAREYVDHKTGARDTIAGWARRLRVAPAQLYAAQGASGGGA